MAEAAFVPKRLVNAQGETADFEAYREKAAVAFCGIGNPEGFQQTLADCGLVLDASRFRTFADHHHYISADLESLGQLAHQKQAAGLFTTQKDLVKIPQTEIAGVPLWAVEIGVEWLTGSQELTSRLQELIALRS
jgi:tetraacyldisaccharide 4'-kinase